MNREGDEWAHDPSVQAMRRVFRAMESAQKSLIETLSLSPFDARLRRWRERAQVAFDVCWARAARRGMDLGEEDAADLYLLGFQRILAGEGIDIPEDIVPRNRRVLGILQESNS